MVELNEEENKKIQNLITLAETDWLKFQKEIDNLNFSELKKFKNFFLFATERCEKQIKELRTFSSTEITIGRLADPKTEIPMLYLCEISKLLPGKTPKEQQKTTIEKLEKYIKFSGDIIPSLSFRISKIKNSIFCYGFFGLIVTGIGAAAYFATSNEEPKMNNFL